MMADGLAIRCGWSLAGDVAIGSAVVAAVCLVPCVPPPTSALLDVQLIMFCSWSHVVVFFFTVRAQANRRCSPVAGAGHQHLVQRGTNHRQHSWTLSDLLV